MERGAGAQERAVAEATMRRSDGRSRRDHHAAPGVEGLERRALLAARAAAATEVLDTTEVAALLQRAAAATSSNDAIIAVVDRSGRLLGLRVESGVDPAITGDTHQLVFAVDGAIAKARTGAFFGNNQAPLTSRTIQLISQTTMTQREIQSDPSIKDPNSTLKGPGFVAPVGIKGHFPPGIRFTPQVDLFAIEHTNRDSIVHPGADRIKGTADDIILPYRFNIDPAFLSPAAQADPLFAPESYGFISGLEPDSQSRGIATLPGGIPIVENGQVVGGIGVFFPGKTGFATEENSQLNNAGFYDPSKPDRSLEAEFIAFAAVGGSKGANASFAGPLHGAPALPGFDLPFGRIDLVGITLDLFGGHGLQGLRNLLTFARKLPPGSPNDGTNLPVDRSGATLLDGKPVPQGWIVEPHAGGGLTAEDVRGIIQRGIVEANRVRAAIRLPLDSTARMVFSVTDNDGNVLGLFRMPDATIFSIDVAVAKARNVAYYADPAELQPIDQIPGVPAGTAFTNRTFRYASLPRFPEGIDVYPPGPFSILTDGGVLHNGRNDGPPLPASAYQSVQGYDAFNPGTNFHDPFNVANQNGVVFFPGSAPLYKDTNGDGIKELVGGLGVSGDGVDQDDDVTFVSVKGFEPPGGLRADMVKVRGVRLPYIKFNRQPHEPVGQPKQPFLRFKNLPAPRGPNRNRS
jgi:uncharacterized protein GlcG (DUF336 family)